MGKFQLFFVNSIYIVYIVNSVYIVVVYLIRHYFDIFKLSYDVSHILFYLLVLSGDVEMNPGPRLTCRPQCRALYSNIRGLYKNFNELIGVSRQYDIIFCSETLVSSRRHLTEILIPNFKKPILLRSDAFPRARGMALYIRNDFSATNQKSYECSCHEMQIVKVCGRHSNFYIFSIYRNPDASDSIYDCLLSSMAHIQQNDRKSSFVFVGDFNAHHREWLNSISPTDRHGLCAYDFSSESGCVQLVSEPTHVSGNCLDLILTDVPGVVTSSVGSPIGTSDHSRISATIRIQQTVPDISFSRKVFLKSQANWNGILFDLSLLNWPDMYKQIDPISPLDTALSTIIEKHVPSRILQYRFKDKAWFDDECRRALQEKQEAYFYWRSNRSDLTWNNYKRLRAQAQIVYDNAERNFNGNIKEKLLGVSNPHKWWATFKSALFGVDQTGPPLLKRDGTLAYCPKEKAAAFADVFDSKQCGDDLDMPLTCFPEPRLTKIAFKSREVKILLAELDVYGGAGPDGIFPLFFVKMADFLAPKITTILRKLARTGQFSSCWRTGHISPVPKGNSASSAPSDYRPISITPVLSKVFERLLSKRLYAYAESNNLFPNLQFGFRKGLGACDALLTISNLVQRALDHGQEVRMIGLDFSSAFDRVNHKALLFKLRQLGVGGPLFDILTNFLSNRSQRVVVDGQLGDLRPVLSGVPQGSVLGPLLFILYTHDMWFDLENLLVSYADDATLLAVVPSPDARVGVCNSLNRDLAKISSWCKTWGMKMNPTKTQSMIVGRSRTAHPPHPDLLIDNIPLVSSSSFKILGVLFDQKFTFESHLRATSSMIAQKLGLLRKSLRIFNDQSILRKCFYSFILPCFEYCSPVWSSAADSHLRLLDRNLNACRFLIPDLDVDLWHRRSISSLCMLYKIFHNPKHPLYSELPSLFRPVRMTRNVASSHNLNFSLVRCSTVQYSRCFIPSNVRSWNDLPGDVVESLELQKFKTGANRFLINSRLAT